MLRRLARPMMATIFVASGLNTLRNPAPQAEATKPWLDRAGDALPTDAETLVRIDAAVKVGAGLALGMGRFPRLAALLLAANLVPTTVVGHPFWEEKDPEQRAGQMVHFMKNLGLIGGLLVASADTAGKPSLGWRARRAVRKAAKHAPLPELN